jgi:hypothetical protein
VEVEYDRSTWVINRRFKQFTEMDSGFRRTIPGYTDLLPKKKDKKQKFDETFLKERLKALDFYVGVICNSRPAIFASDVSFNAFSRFFAPVQYGDVKGPDFILPFKLIL